MSSTITFFNQQVHYFVFRIEEVKKITKRRLDQVEYIRQRLHAKYGENWQDIPHKIIIDEGLTPPKQRKIKDEKDSTVSTNNSKKSKANSTPAAAAIAQQSTPNSTTAATTTTTSAPTTTATPATTKAKPVKKRKPKSERDPNAPKRPSNPFFQFCQEQRQPLMEQLMAEQKPGETEPINKQELTRQLAIKWKTLTAEDKQIYVDMYERSKEKYAAEMTEYKKK